MSERFVVGGRGVTASGGEAPGSAPVYILLGPDGPYRSTMRGRLGGNRRGRIYGRLDCPAALRAIARGGYVPHRVFFADAQTAVAAGYRPCGICLSQEYRAWRSGQPRNTTVTGGSP